MSSVVKKSSQFVPKIKRKPVRRSVHASPPPSQALPLAPTPENSQVSPLAVPSKTHDVAAATDAEAAESRNSLTATSFDASSFAATLFSDTYVPPTPTTQKAALSQADTAPAGLLAYSLGGSHVADGPVPDAEDAVDPHDATAAVEDDDDDYGDNDIFKHPEPKAHRRLLVAGHRRLLAISFKRAGSVSVTPAGPEDDMPAPPVAITIPVGKPTKRRASSAARASKRASRASVIVPPSVLSERDELAAETSSKTTQSETGTGAPVRAGSPIVVGLDPLTKKLRKYRASPDVEGYSHLPVAPDDLVTEITEVSQIPHKITAEDHQYYANVRFQPDQLRMSDLCKPLLPIGSVSENYKMAMEAKEKIAQKRQLRRAARELAKTQRISYEDAYRKVLLDGDHEFDLEDDKKTGFDFDAPDENHASGVQVEIIDNKILVRLESMIVGGQRPASLSQNRNVTLENPFENPITSNSYTKSAHTDAWTDEEMVQLYRALSTWGTDFTFIAQLFPYRTRRQVKRKFILEEKKNPELIELALRRKLPADLAEFQQAASTVSLKNVEDHEREMLELKKDHERHMEEITLERERAIKEDLEASRKREIEIRTGAKPMTRTERQREFRKNETVVGSIEDVKKSREEMERAAQ